MQRLFPRQILCALIAAWILGSSLALAQGVLITVQNVEPVLLPRPPIIICPPRPATAPARCRSRQAPTKSKQLEVNAKLDGQVAKVQVSQSFVNTGSRPMEVCFVFPLPYDGAIDQLTLLIDGKEFPAKLLDANEARQMYEEIVRKNRDPALLEWMGTGLVQDQRVSRAAGRGAEGDAALFATLPQWDGLTDFLFPLSTAKYTSHPVEEIKFNVAIESETEIKNVYSPRHAVEIKRPDDKHAVVSYTAKNKVPTDDFRLFYDVGKGIVGTRRAELSAATEAKTATSCCWPARRSKRPMPSGRRRPWSWSSIARAA